MATAVPALPDDAPIEVGGAQTTKTRKALEFVSRQLRAA
jgi:hypothetical protein